MSALTVREAPPETSGAARPRLLDQVRLELRRRHYSPRTEEAYAGWIRRFILHHGKRHPAEMGECEVVDFLSSLATRNRVSPSTQNQALAALLFLYRDILRRKLDWLQGVTRASRPPRLPVVLTRAEVGAILGRLEGAPRLMATLLYGAGLRLMECCRLRVKDVDLARNEILVRDGKGRKDRVTMLPAALRDPLAVQLRAVRALHERDLARGWGHVELPGALARKYPNASREPGWQWVFPATRVYADRETGQRRRHHLHESVLQRLVKLRSARPASSSSRAATRCDIRSPRISSKALPFCHVTLRGQKPLPAGYPAHPKTLGDQLRKRRMDLGLSQRELARQLGVNRTSIEYWERNEVEPARWMVPMIREYLGLQSTYPPTSFAERLTACRRGLGLSQEVFARMIGVHKTTVVRWETGRRRPSRGAGQRLASHLKFVP